MKQMTIVIYIIATFPLIGMAHETPSPGKLRTLYNRINPSSISQHLAFYELYPNTIEGKEALSEAWKLLSGKKHIHTTQPLESMLTTSEALSSIVNLVNKPINETTPLLTQETIDIIIGLTQHLPHRRLLGHKAQSEEEVLRLSNEEVDLARGLFLSQLSDQPDMLHKTLSYEAMLDLMALQILTQVSLESSSLEKMRAITHFIFHEIGFRYPPHSLDIKDIDLYTFLPSVLDSRRGVCLGVSVLYLSLAQRLGLPLEIITPPGHIYLRYRVNPQEVINIETTARGINIESERYLGVDTCRLEERTIKDVIGMVHINEASVYWQREKYDKAQQAYLKAYPYLPDYMLLKELMGYNALFLGNEKEARRLLGIVQDYIPEHSISKNCTPKEFLTGKADVNALKAIFMPVDETRGSILAKRDALVKIIETHPLFSTGVFALAITQLQLHRIDSALELLEKYHNMNREDVTAEYYLAVLYSGRFDYIKAWEHLHFAEQLTQAKNYQPKILKNLRKELSLHCPE